MNSFTRFARERTYSNKLRRCSVPDCEKPRNCISRFCTWHKDANRRYGHPLGRIIEKQELAGYVQMAKTAFKRMGDQHPALVAAVDLMQTHLDPRQEPNRGKRPSHNPRWALWRELERLRGVDPTDALAVAVAVWMFSAANPRELPDNARLSYALAHCIFRMKPLGVRTSRYKPTTGTFVNKSHIPGGQAAGLLGRRLRAALAPFLVNITEALEEEYRARCEKASQEAALRTPINFSDEYNTLAKETAR
jgi:hypothetical protein